MPVFIPASTSVFARRSTGGRQRPRPCPAKDSVQMTILAARRCSAAGLRSIRPRSLGLAACAYAQADGEQAPDAEDAARFYAS
jgi:hypothetical protein